jgi:2,4-dienoyl-CoA reductase-like NADH-dependent reductase (Old Yellow Enzyme family)
MTPALFSPIQLGGLTLANRLVVAPMCQYSAEDGSATPWHLMHLGSLANSGAGLLILEATAVERRGRITHGCLGLYTDENERALAPVLDACRRYGSAKLGIQLGHAGRKASSKRPWEGKTMQDPLESDTWPCIAPSAVAMTGHPVPSAMTIEDLQAVRDAFVEAVQRCKRLGLDLIELHGAHGYLLHAFLSPLSNTRTDGYGGTLAGRMRFPLEVFAACRAVWPADKPLGIRVSATDWIDGGLTLDESVHFAREIKKLGGDFIHVSTGGIDPTARIPVGPSYQVPHAARIKQESGLATMAVGMITDARQAEAILAEGQADMVAAARAFLDDPHWGWHAAYTLGAELTLPPQYRRAGLKAWAPAERHARKA